MRHKTSTCSEPSARNYIRFSNIPLLFGYIPQMISKVIRDDVSPCLLRSAAVPEAWATTYDIPARRKESSQREDTHSSTSYPSTQAVSARSRSIFWAAYKQQDGDGAFWGRPLRLDDFSAPEFFKEDWLLRLIWSDIGRGNFIPGRVVWNPLRLVCGLVDTSHGSAGDRSCLFHILKATLEGGVSCEVSQIVAMGR